jgi:hypothetical protein
MQFGQARPFFGKISSLDPARYGLQEIFSSQAEETAFIRDTIPDLAPVRDAPCESGPGTLIIPNGK